MSTFTGKVKQISPEKVIEKKDGGQMTLTELWVESLYESVLLKCFDAESDFCKTLLVGDEIRVDFVMTVRSSMSKSGTPWFEQNCRCHDIKVVNAVERKANV